MVTATTIKEYVKFICKFPKNYQHTVSNFVLDSCVHQCICVIFSHKNRSHIHYKQNKKMFQ